MVLNYVQIVLVKPVETVIYMPKMLHVFALESISQNIYALLEALEGSKNLLTNILLTNEEVLCLNTRGIPWSVLHALGSLIEQVRMLE